MVREGDKRMALALLLHLVRFSCPIFLWNWCDLSSLGSLFEDLESLRRICLRSTLSCVPHLYSAALKKHFFTNRMGRHPCFLLHIRSEKNLR